MNPYKTLRVAGLAACVAVGLAGATQAAPIMPTSTDFGPLPAATFGGTGIDNNNVTITTITDGVNTITLGLAATSRFANPVVQNDGAGTYTALPGSNFPALPATQTEGALWNFSFYANIEGGGTFDDYDFALLYDFDPAANTDETAHGILFGNAPTPLIEGSQNLMFNFLSLSLPGVIPPAFGPFDPNATGEYTFALRVSRTGVIGGPRPVPLGQAAIRVNVVPEPGTLAIMGLGLVGLGLARRRKRA